MTHFFQQIHNVQLRNGAELLLAVAVAALTYRVVCRIAAKATRVVEKQTRCKAARVDTPSPPLPTYDELLDGAFTGAADWSAQ
jgi:hypothetical protein